MEICLECNQSFESKSKLSYHIFHTHNLTSKMYYDKHLKKDNDGICLNCGRPTLFKNLVRGYKKSCCKECERKCAEITNKVPLNLNGLILMVKKELIYLILK